MTTVATAGATTGAGRAGRLLWLLLMLVMTPVYALGPSDDDTRPTGQPPAALQPPLPDTDAGTDRPSRPSPLPTAPRSPADSFTPSERIGADSAVAFPVDI